MKIVSPRKDIFLKKEFSRSILIGRKINERGDMIFPPSLLCTKHVDLFMIAGKTNERERERGRERSVFLTEALLNLFIYFLKVGWIENDV